MIVRQLGRLNIGCTTELRVYRFKTANATDGASQTVARGRVELLDPYCELAPLY